MKSLYNEQSLGQVFTNQGANYHLQSNSNLLLYSCDPFLGELVRNALNNYTAAYFDISAIADGGDLIIENEIKNLFEQAMLANKTVVIIGAEPKIISDLQKEFIASYYPLSVSFISDQANIVDDIQLDSIYLKELNLIGFQRQQLLHSNKMLNYFRLGEYRNNPGCIEPAIRSSDLIYFSLNAIRTSDSPGSFIKNPSGFYAEDAASIARNIGMSDRLKIFAISAWNENKDPDKISANLVAQMIWYFWEGCHLKQLDHHIDKESLTQYLVELKDLDYIIKFYKSENSGKWWFEEPLIDNEFSNQLVPCSYDEYLATAKDQIPKRILEMINS